MKRILVLHPFCFTIYFLLNTSTALRNPSVLNLFISGVILLTFVYFLNCFVGLFVKDKIKRGVITTIILVPILFYPQLLEIFQDYLPGSARNRYVLSVTLVSVILLISLVAKTKKKLFTFNQYLNVLSTCFIIYGLILVVNARIQNGLSEYEGISNYSETELQATTQPVMKDFPDIYYIILDAYTGHKALNEYLNFSNEDFINELKVRGFYIAADSHSFAPSTVFSMVSTLNMSNDERLLKAPQEFLLKLIENNQVEKFLESRGYETINLSLFPLHNSPQFYKIFSDPDSSEIARIFRNTLVYILAEQIEQSRIYKTNFRILLSLKAVACAAQNNPRFIYAHLFIPHEPIILDRDANIIPLWKRKGIMDSAAYIEQVLGTNKLILEVIDEILSKSVKKPVIILQGDHGYWRGKYGENTKLSILNAYYLPGKSCEVVWPSISPYNSFRVIFNAYFKTNYKILYENNKQE